MILNKLKYLLLLVALTGCPSDTSENPGESIPSPVEPVVTPSQPDANRPTAIPPVSTRPPRMTDTGPLNPSFAWHQDDDRLEIDHLISMGDIRQLTGYTGALHEALIDGQTPSSSYNSIRYGLDDRLGLGLQVWKHSSNVRTTAHFNRLHETYIDPTSSARLGDTAFVSDFGGIRQIVIMSRRQNLVLAISCDHDTCLGIENLEDLAERITGRL